MHYSHSAAGVPFSKGRVAARDYLQRVSAESDIGDVIFKIQLHQYPGALETAQLPNTALRIVHSVFNSYAMFSCYYRSNRSVPGTEVPRKITTHVIWA
jgi:hypothetical protein